MQVSYPALARAVRIQPDAPMVAIESVRFMAFINWIEVVDESHALAVDLALRGFIAFAVASLCHALQAAEQTLRQLRQAVFFRHFVRLQMAFQFVLFFDK